MFSVPRSSAHHPAHPSLICPSWPHHHQSRIHQSTITMSTLVRITCKITTPITRLPVFLGLDPTIEYCWTTLIQIQMFILSSRETTYYIRPDISDISCMQKVQIYQIYPYLLHTSEATVTGVVVLMTSITVMLIYHTV